MLEALPRCSSAELLLHIQSWGSRNLSGVVNPFKFHLCFSGNVSTTPVRNTAPAVGDAEGSGLRLRHWERQAPIFPVARGDSLGRFWDHRAALNTHYSGLFSLFEQYPQRRPCTGPSLLFSEQRPSFMVSTLSRPLTVPFLSPLPTSSSTQAALPG